MKSVKLCLIGIALLLVACEAENIEDLFEGVECRTENVGFAADVKPVLETHCLNCHNALAALGGVILQTHEDVKFWVDNGRLLGSIQHLPGFSPMPQIGEKLDECSIEQIESWIADGAPDN